VSIPSSADPARPAPLSHLIGPGLLAALALTLAHWSVTTAVLVLVAAWEVCSLRTRYASRCVAQPRTESRTHHHRQILH
jgi:hypothetical protein